MVLASIEVNNLYIVCGYTDMRKSIAGLSAIIVQTYKLRPDEHSLFLFCGKRADRLKALLWEGDGFLLLYKVLHGFRYQWPRSSEELKNITPAQYHRLLEGLTLEPRHLPPPRNLI